MEENKPKSPFLKYLLVFGFLSVASAAYYLNTSDSTPAAIATRWQKNEEPRNLQVGDTVTSVESTKIELNDGTRVVAAADSNIEIINHDNKPVANLAQGNFRLPVKGKARLAVGGKVANIESENSDVQIVVDKDGSAKMRVLQGKAKIQMSSLRKPVEVGTNEVVTLNEEQPMYMDRMTASEAPAEPAVLLPKADVPQYLVKDFWIWGGIGVAMVNYSQDVSGFSEMKFGKIESVTQHLKGGFMFDDNWGLDLNYTKIPGEAKSSDTITLANGSYNWQTMSAELLYCPDRGVSEKSQWIYRLGIQQQDMPTMVATTTASISLESVSATNLSVGVEYRHLTKKKIRIETMVRYQHHLGNSSNAALSVDPKLSFDGSIGAAYQINKDVYAGVYLSGQYHDSSIEYQRNGNPYSGEQTLLNSNVSFRLGVEF